MMDKKNQATDWIKTAKGCLSMHKADKPLLRGILRSGIEIVSELQQESQEQEAALMRVLEPFSVAASVIEKEYEKLRQSGVSIRDDAQLSFQMGELTFLLDLDTFRKARKLLQDYKERRSQHERL